MGLTFPSIFDPDGRVQLQFSDSLPPQAIPSTLVIDGNGLVAARILGKVSAATLGESSTRWLTVGDIGTIITSGSMLVALLSPWRPDSSPSSAPAFFLSRRDMSPTSRE